MWFQCIRYLVFPSIVLVFLIGSVPGVMGQLPAQAVIGAPFGVGTVTLSLSDDARRIWSVEGFQIIDPENRVLYPSFSQGTVRRFLAEVAGLPGPEQARSVEVFFLFRGDKPFEFVIETDRPERIRVNPLQGRRGLNDRLWRSWWREFNASARIQDQRSDYPPVIESYLITSLAVRMGLELPPLSRRLANEPTDELRETIELLMGVEELRYGILRETVQGRADSGKADLPVPPNIAWGEPHRFSEPDEVAIEPIAGAVPEECLYVRFGTWSNQVWLKQFIKTYGEDLSQLLALRGFDARLDARLQEQIGIVDSQVIDLLGGNLIQDVALIGFDTFLREGAAMGIVLHQRSGLLAGSLSSQRASLLRKWKDQGATEERLRIRDQDVTLISTPDNRIRAFYVAQGEFHLLTNSQRLVERFLEASAGERSLSQSTEFRATRLDFPLDRQDTVFIHLPSALFRNLLTPQYQIELRRRLASVTDIELVHLARAASRAEGVPTDEVEKLIELGYLPQEFGRRPDGSGVVVTEEDVWDSMRGRRGFFLPIPDVKISGVTSREEQAYQERASYFASQWERTDPLTLTLKRESLDRQTFKVTIDGRLAPFGEAKYGWVFSLLGPPMDQGVRVADEDVVCIQASVRGGLLLPIVPPHRLFVTIQNEAPLPTEGPPSALEALGLLRSAPGVLGAAPKPGFLDVIPLGLGAEPDESGLTRSLLGVWRWQGADVSLLGFDPERLRRTGESLEMTPFATPAQVHVRVGDLGASELRPWLEQVTYWRARQTTIGNLGLLAQMSRQLKIPPDQALKEAERLLDVTLRCPLGGEYQLESPPGLSPRWRSTNLDPLADTPTSIPPVRVLNWLAGAEASLLKEDSQVVLHAELTLRENREAMPERAEPQ